MINLCYPFSHTVEFSVCRPHGKRLFELLLVLHRLHLPDALHLALPLLPCIRYVCIL